LQSHRHLLLAAAGQALLSAPYVPGPCQEIALRSLSTTDELFQPVRDEIARRRGYLRDRLVGMGLVPTQAVAGPFCFVPVSSLGLSGRDFAQKLYEAQRVVVGPGDLYGPASSGWIRVSSAVEDGRLREGLTRLGQFVQGLRPSLGSRVTHDVVIPQKPVVEYEPAFSRS
jgi:aspartate/methionine/tyrosine aminotransferase